MSTPPCCPRCAHTVRAPDLMHSDWRCPVHGAVPPLHVARQLGTDVLDAVRVDAGVPVWLPWPMLPDWTVTGLAWAGDDRRPIGATAVACTGPAPLGGVADVVLVAEEPGVGLGSRLAGRSGTDPGETLCAGLLDTNAHAKIVAAGHPTPLWSIQAGHDRCAYVGEAKGMWLWAIAWPEEAGYVLAEHFVLLDGRDGLPGPLPFGALSPYLQWDAPEEGVS
ncbi:DUF6758 family protein [Cryptosporangium arvum]|uniref:DUF6758 family protein n=1 Tax=Cryptosporangium arvum TaxID=80871 RepID=UPI001B80C31D|nr:DUF6758 family protein [Cryptosporangium arvum]